MIWPLSPAHGPRDGQIVEGRPTGQQAVERGAEAVNVAGRPDLPDSARRLLGAHVMGRADHRPGHGLAAGQAAGGFGSSPAAPRPISLRPTTLARPQSTSSVSP